MPTYKITDPATGKSVRITGDSPPDGNDIEEIFSHLESKQSATPEQSKEPKSGGSSVMRAVLTPLEIAGNVVSRVSDAPVRAGINAAMNKTEEQYNANPDESPSLLSAIRNAPSRLSAFAQGYGKQFGRDPSDVPSGKALMQRAGVSSEGSTLVNPYASQPYMPYDPKRNQSPGPSPAGIGGVAIEAGSPMIGIGAISGLAKAGISGATSPIARMAAKGASKAIEGTAAAADAVSGTKIASGSLNVAKDIASGTRDAAKSAYKAIEKTYSGKYDPEFKKMSKIAEDNGLDPEDLPKSLKFGKNSVASKQERHLMEAFGADEADKFDKTLGKVQSAVRKEIEDIGTGKKLTGSEVLGKSIPATKYEAGERIKSAYDNSVEDYFKNLDVSYQKLAAENPGMKIPPETMAKFDSKLNSMSEYANKLIKNSFDDVSQAQGHQLLKAVERAKQSSGNYADFVDALQGVGRTAFKVKNTMAAIPPDVASFRKLYGHMSELAVETAGKNLGKDVAEDLIAKNKEMHNLFGDKNILAGLGEVTKTPDKMFDAIISNPLRIKTIKKYLPEDEVQAMKGKVLKDLLKENSEGEFGFRSLRTAFNNKKEVFSALFDPGELKNLDNLITLGDKFGPKVLSTSGTGASNQITGMVSKLANSVTKPVALVGAGVEKALAKRQVSSAAKGAKKVGNPPGMNFAGGPSLKNIVNTAGSKVRSTASRLYYDEQNSKDQ